MSVPFPPLLEEHDIDQSPTLTTRRNSVFRYKWLSVLATSIASLSMTVFLLFIPSLFAQHSNSATSFLQCGNTSAQALSSNCHFDPMSFSWLPSPCYDSQLSEQFLTLKNWQWFNSPNMTEDAKVEKEEVLKGEHDYLWVSWEYHKLHCTYMWRKMHRAVLRGGFVDQYIGNYEHTEHCEEILMGEGVEMEGSRGLTVIRRKFVGCQRKGLR